MELRIPFRSLFASFVPNGSNSVRTTRKNAIHATALYIIYISRTPIMNADRSIEGLNGCGITARDSFFPDRYLSRDLCHVAIRQLSRGRAKL